MTAYQKQTLWKTFRAKPDPERDEKHQLAKSLNVSEKRIRQWFENRRYVFRQKGFPVEFGEEFSIKYSINVNILKNTVCFNFTGNQLTLSGNFSSVEYSIVRNFAWPYFRRYDHSTV